MLYKGEKKEKILFVENIKALLPHQHKNHPQSYTTALHSLCTKLQRDQQTRIEIWTEPKWVSQVNYADVMTGMTMTEDKRMG